MIICAEIHPVVSGNSLFCAKPQFCSPDAVVKLIYASNCPNCQSLEVTSTVQLRVTSAV